ncbi:MAG: hypothetical protein HY076_05445 [Candidatus Eisenbacteria bacterium]|uniref:Uncharacterized protein n=1 Tax=Eiseniibacteriota bacterium TaxID=2212470 RepID=A0A9D6L699_UNCEI|nr:hypothetical protein [Candidatus Eisenbacteria bacterium]MBI3539698.1 hypothetical protein [Candidatus Eisenbacteria bacterium]
MDFTLEPSVMGVAFAAFAVAAGAPVFGDGLRAFRLRRHLAALKEAALADAPTGFVYTRGRVVLDAPLFAPLSNRPCAGFRLELRGAGARPAAVIERRQPFRIVSGATSARVVATDGAWRLTETGRRTIAPGDAISEHLTALFEDCAELFWMRRQSQPVVLVERALMAGDEAHVVGQMRVARPYEMPVESEALRTGTDDAAIVETHTRSGGPFGIERRQPGRPFASETDLWMDRGGHLDFVLVSDAEPAAAALAPPPWRMAGLVLGPALSLGALTFLAHAADVLRAHARF